MSVRERPADRLLPALAGVRRALRRRVRERMAEPRLGAALVELLRTVEEAPGCSVGEAARALHLAQNSVSTLVRQAVDAGLLERHADAEDRRTARLTLTGAATARLARNRAARGDVVDAALARLDDADRAVLHAAVPALRRLVAALEEHTEEEHTRCPIPPSSPTTCTTASATTSPSTGST